MDGEELAIAQAEYFALFEQVVESCRKAHNGSPITLASAPRALPGTASLGDSVVAALHEAIDLATVRANIDDLRRHLAREG